MDEKGLNKIGERLFNLQRAILTREGHVGRNSDTISEYNFTKPLKFDLHDPGLLYPAEGDTVVSREGTMLDKASFEKMKDEYYMIRGWDISTGLQKRGKLEELDLSEIADDLSRRKLLSTE